MANSLKKVLGALGATALLAGCATGYYDGYYGEPAYGYGYGSSYYGYPGYYSSGPTIGFGATYVERDGYRGDWHRDRDGRWRDRDGNVRAPDATWREPVPSAGAIRSDDGRMYSRPLGEARDGTRYWQGSDGRVYEGTNPPGVNLPSTGG